MGAFGSNLLQPDSTRLWQYAFKFVGLNAEGTIFSMQPNDKEKSATALPRFINILSKTSATAPTTDTTNDNPTGIGDICVHFNTSGVVQGVYACTSYTNTTTFTWTKIW